jgi:glutathione peroxidase
MHGFKCLTEVKLKHKKMKYIFVAALLAFLFPIQGKLQQIKSFYDYTVKTIDGEDFNLSSLKGKKVMVVNTASKCGFTPQYADLEKLYKEFGGDRFIIIGFPANNFLSQEPGTNEEIETFCRVNYGVSFPMMAKISVKGNDMHPLYQWLTKKSLNGVMDADVKWNFQKFLINENGQLVDVAFPKEKPNSDKILNWLKN